MTVSGPLRIRVAPGDLDLYTSAAVAAGLSVTRWAHVALRAAVGLPAPRCPDAPVSAPPRARSDTGGLRLRIYLAPEAQARLARAAAADERDCSAYAGRVLREAARTARRPAVAGS